MEWLHETLLIDPSTRREGLEAMFAQRIHGLTAGSKTDLLVTWTIGGSGPLMAELRRGKLRGELLEWLRIEHGLSSPIVWTVGIELGNAKRPAGVALRAGDDPRRLPPHAAGVRTRSPAAVERGIAVGRRTGGRAVFAGGRDRRRARRASGSCTKRPCWQWNFWAGKRA